MKPQHIIILRHGESQANVDKSIYEHTPDYLVELTQKGREQCKACGQQLKPLLDDKKLTVWTSPYTRARQTAQIVLEQIEGASVSIKEDPRLREQDWGNFYSLEEAKQKSSERRAFSYFFYRIPHGEAGTDVYDRISTFLETLYRDFDTQKEVDTILISSHGITSLIFLMRFFHWKYEQYECVKKLENCDYIVLELDAKTQRYAISETKSSTILFPTV